MASSLPTSRHVHRFRMPREDWWKCHRQRRAHSYRIHLVNVISARSIGGRIARCPYRFSRLLYLCVFPDTSVLGVDKPVCTLRRFTPDGRHMIAISGDQQCVEIYSYLGVAGVGRRIPRPCDAAPSLFSQLFHLRHSVRVTVAGENLNRECSLFTDDGLHVIVASVTIVTDIEQRHMAAAGSRTNEWLLPGTRTPLENYSLHVVHVESGRRCDTVHFERDKIFTSHNQGICLYDNVLAVLSVQHQTLHIYLIDTEGCLLPIRTVGRFCIDDDQTYFNATAPATHRLVPASDRFMCSLKHRLLVFLYRQAASFDDPAELLRFFRHFDHYCSLRMWKMQLLDRQHVLVRYSTEDVVTYRVEHAFQPSLFAVYQFESSRILCVYSNTSNQLLYLYEHFCDYLRNARLSVETCFICSPSNNVHAHRQQSLFRYTVRSARHGSSAEATRRLLTQLPISCQSYSCSPYLDMQLYSYDEKWVSAMERPKPCGEQPIKFFARQTGSLRFCLQAGLPSTRLMTPSSRRLVAFIFHPTDPFAVSVQRTNAEYVVNFHLRYDDQ